MTKVILTYEWVAPRRVDDQVVGGIEGGWLLDALKLDDQKNDLGVSGCH